MVRARSLAVAGHQHHATEGELTGSGLTVTVESDQLVAFGDGIESDCLTPTWAQTVTIGAARRTLHLVA